MALYHSARGNVGYTIVGTPTIVDGVASGFSANNHLVINSNFDPTKPYIIQVKFKLTSSGTSGSTMIGVSTSGLFSIRYEDDRQAIAWSMGSQGNWSIGHLRSSTILSYNVDYWIQAEFTGSKYILRLSGNGKTFTEEATLESTSTPNNGNPFTLLLGDGHTQHWYMRGSLDLNNTYIMQSGQLWFGICPIEVKKHQLKGPVGYTVTGSPTITDGVLSGTSSSNYCSVNVNVPSFNTLEVIMRAKFTGRINSSAFMPLWAFGGGVSPRRITNNFTTASDGGTRLFSNEGVIVNIPNTDFDLNTYALDFYYTRIRVTKNTDDYTYELSVSADGTTWVTKSGNYASNICTGFFYLCRNSSGSSGGNVYCDLNETYIKVNGKLWFWQPQETKYIQRNNQLVFADPKLYLSGPVNYEVVGTPTITDGVASGFTSVSALKINALLPEGDIEAKFDFTMGDTVEYSGTQTIFSFDRLFGISKSNYGNLASWDYRANTWRTVVPAADLTAKSRYVVQCTRTGTTYSFSYSKDGGPFVSSVTYNSTGGTPSTNNFIGSNLNMADRYFTGTINLNNSFVKVNGELWFFGKNYATQNIAPVPVYYPLTVKGPANYIVVGSPTITDGVISNMDGNNYVKMSSMPPFGNKDFEIKVVVNANVKKPMRIISNNVTAATMTSIVVTNTSGAIKGSFYDGTNIYDVTAPSAGNLVTGSKFYINFYRNGTTLGIKTSTDNTNWNEATTTIPSTSSFANNGSVFSLSAVSQGVPFDGSIYLDETYIKINGQPWFGKAYPVPSIGYVDMRTQVFTAAPEGAVVGRDE